MLNYTQTVIWTRKEKFRSSLLLFLIGLFASTRIYFFGIVAISELPILLLAPIVFYYDRQDLKHDGFYPVIMLFFASMVMLVVGSMFNHCMDYYRVIINKEAMMYSLIAHIIVFHRLSRGNIRGLRWLLLGFFLSAIIKIWYFNPKLVEFGSGMAGIEDADLEDVLSGPLFWSSRLKGLITLLASGWYMSFPVIALVIGAVATVGFVSTHTESGRAAMATLLLGVLFIVLGRKKKATLQKFARRFLIVILAAFVGLFGIKTVYGFAAKNGYLGDKAYTKYLRQTRNGTSALNMLMAGRVEFFIQLRAALDRPFLGYGILAVDQKGYARHFAVQYGSDADIKNYEKRIMNMPIGMQETIPRHSHILTFWLDSGLIGFLAWGYLLALIFRYFSKYAPSCPYLFGYLSLSLTAYIWNVLFNPVTSRSADAAPIVFLLLVRAMYHKKIVLDPYDCGLLQKRKMRRIQR